MFWQLYQKMQDALVIKFKLDFNQNIHCRKENNNPLYYSGIVLVE